MMSAEITSNKATLLLVGVLCCLCFSSSSDIRLPPSITVPPVESKIFRNDDEIVLECVATGVPTPNYEWLKNGAPLTIPAVMGNIFHHNHPAEGSIQIKPLTYLDEGVYQCVASNEFGKTLSSPTVLQRAYMTPYSIGTQPIETPWTKAGEPLMIQCHPTKCFPKPSYSWALSSTSVSAEQTPIILSRRVQVDEHGHLHFAYLLPSDAQDGKLYKCNLFNPYNDVTMGGSYTEVKLLPGELVPSGPTLLFSSESTTIALEGKNVSLRCFFGGYPEPLVSWSAGRGHQLPRGRYQILNYFTEMAISNLVQADEGPYICRAGTQEYSIRLDVQAVPVFNSAKNRPQNVNVTEGDDVTIVCNAYADPPATVTWFINGDTLDIDHLPPRVRIASDGTRLTVSNVCRDCPNGLTDIRVIQCNASNTHGAVYGSGYINVLKKTVMDDEPINVTVTATDSFASFNCSGSSDDSTPVTVKWFKFADKDTGYLPVREIPGQVVLETNGSLSFHLPDNSSRWNTHVGLYNCSVSNGYSVLTKAAFLQLQDYEPPVILPTQAAFPWWIIIVALVVLLLILLLICCCCYVCRNRGETYPVDEKERKNGHNPEKELADSGFQDYIRPEHLMAGSKGSLASTRKTISDDEMSLNEYGDIDAGKFTEDGSFIGDYGDRAYV